MHTSSLDENLTNCIDCCLFLFREDLPGCGLVRKGTYLNISVYSKNYRTYYLRLETEEIALEWERAIRGNSETLKKRYSYTDSITLASGL